MIKFHSHTGEELLALTELTHTSIVNGEKSLSGTIYTNNDVLNNVDRGWTLEFENETYYITYAKPVDQGNGIVVNFDAIHEFFYKMGKSVVYEVLSDGSHTAEVYFDTVFNGSGYNYSLDVSVAAFEKQNFGMKNRLSLFNDLIDSTGLEFLISGNTVTITKQIGSDLSTIVRKGFNLQELTLEHNISDFVTYAKGYGAYLDENDQSKGRVEAEYKSPLADVYGVLEADPVSDERYTQVESLQNRLKELVDGSYTISVEVTLEDLQKAGYGYALPKAGDYILAVDETLDFSQKLRIVGVEVGYDFENNKTDTKITCSSLSMVNQKNNADANVSNTINSIINGTATIPTEWLSDKVDIATEKLWDAETELKFGKNGIVAIDKNDANNVVIFNSAGLGVSTDGGKTFANAITGEGINATTINTGSLNAAKVRIFGTDAYIDLESGGITFKPLSGDAWSTKVNKNGMVIDVKGIQKTAVQNNEINMWNNANGFYQLGGLTTLLASGDGENAHTAGVYLAMKQWHTSNQGDKNWEYGTEDFWGASEMGMATTSGVDGNGNPIYSALMKWSNDLAAGRQPTTTNKGFNFYDQATFWNGFRVNGVADTLRMSWVSWSDWGDYKTFCITAGSAGVAFSNDNVVLYGLGKRADATTGWKA